MKKKFACQLSKKEKGKATGKPQGKTAEEDFPDHFPKLFYASASLGFQQLRGRSMVEMELVMADGKRYREEPIPVRTP